MSEKLTCGCGGDVSVRNIGGLKTCLMWMIECRKCGLGFRDTFYNKEEAIAAFKKATRAEGFINWIPVSERLPQNGQMVIIYCPQFVGLPVDIIEWWENAKNDLEDTTHWAEINLPEVKK
ncbi:MAG: hypothetical protein WC451_03300 [Patescibacteria group bacterium]|jgi:hypothetical protein